MFVEVKMDAEASHSTKADPERNQLIRNLDVGFFRATRDRKTFALVYVTPDLVQPDVVTRIQTQPASFPANPQADERAIRACLYWSSWSDIGEVLAETYGSGLLTDVERRFALDLLAYLCQKGLWKSTLADDPLFYGNKLYRILRTDSSPFIPYGIGNLNGIKDGVPRWNAITAIFLPVWI